MVNSAGGSPEARAEAHLNEQLDLRFELLCRSAGLIVRAELDQR